MENSFLSIIGYALIPVAAAILGGVIAAFRPPSPILRSYIQHTAAGVVFSVVAIELLPDITIHHDEWLQAAFGFGLGVASMLAFREFSHKLEGQGGEERPTGLMLGVGIDILLDGFLIGITFSAGAKEGLLLTFALALEMVSLGLAVSAALGKREKNRRKIIQTTSLLFLIILVGAGIGAAVVQSISPAVLEVVLAFGLAALLFLVTEELLVEAHKEPETPWATGMFFLGFLIFMLLGMV